MCAWTAGPACATWASPRRPLEEYRKALKLDPNHINANSNTGVVLAYDLNDTEGGRQGLSRSTSRLAPDAPDARQIRQAVQELKSAK